MTEASKSFAGLSLEIVDVIDADSAKPVPVRSGKKVAVERSAGREHGLRSGAEAGIALIAQAGLRKTGELIGLQICPLCAGCHPNVGPNPCCRVGPHDFRRCETPSPRSGAYT